MKLAKGCSMGIKEQFLGRRFSFSGNFLEQRDGSLLFNSIIGEGKTFLSKKVLAYRCRIKINDVEMKVYFFEILDERGSGLTTGSGDDEVLSTPGFGFKVEKYNTRNGTRRGTIEEQSALFGKEYTYKFNWNEVKDFAVEVANSFGYQTEFILDERSLQKR
ncbi:MAG: hypothetical protein ACPL2N_00850 [Candidatus Cryosericum sp.]